MLRENLLRNGIVEFVVVVEAALDRAPGVVAMTVESGGLGNAAVEVRPLSTRPVSVVTRTLDQVLQDALAPGWRVSGLKLDVEGWEVRVLEGAERTVGLYRPLVLGEFSAWWQERHGLRHDAVFRWAERHRYEILGCRFVRRGWWTDRGTVCLERLHGPSTPGRYEALLLRPQPGNTTRPAGDPAMGALYLGA